MCIDRARPYDLYAGASEIAHLESFESHKVVDLLLGRRQASVVWSLLLRSTLKLARDIVLSRSISWRHSGTAIEFRGRRRWSLESRLNINVHLRALDGAMLRRGIVTRSTVTYARQQCRVAAAKANKPYKRLPIKPARLVRVYPYPLILGPGQQHALFNRPGIRHASTTTEHAALEVADEKTNGSSEDEQHDVPFPQVIDALDSFGKVLFGTVSVLTWTYFVGIPLFLNREEVPITGRKRYSGTAKENAKLDAYLSRLEPTMKKQWEEPSQGDGKTEDDTSVGVLREFFVRLWKSLVQTAQRWSNSRINTALERIAKAAGLESAPWTVTTLNAACEFELPQCDTGSAMGR